MTITYVLAVLRYVAAHIAAFGGVIKAVVDCLEGNFPAAVNDMLVALAGFGLAVSPPKQETLNELHHLGR